MFIISTSLGFLAFAVLVDLAYRMRLALTFAQAPNLGLDGQRREYDIDRRFGLSQIFSRLLVLGFLCVLIYFTHGVGPKWNGAKVVFAESLHRTQGLDDPHYQEEGFADDNRDSKIASSTITIPEERPLAESSTGDIDFDVLDAKSRQRGKMDQESLPSSSDQDRGLAQSPTSNEATNSGTSTLADDNKSASSHAHAQDGEQAPTSLGPFWLELVTGDEVRVYDELVFWQKFFPDAHSVRDTEKSLFRVRIGPFSTEKEAESTRLQYDDLHLQMKTP